MPLRTDGRKTSTETINEFAAAHYSVAVYCLSPGCGHSARLDLAALAVRHGADTPLARDRFFCSRCGNRRIDFSISYEMPGGR